MEFDQLVEVLLGLSINRKKIVKYVHEKNEGITFRDVKRDLNLEERKAKEFLYDLYRKKIFHRDFRKSRPYISLYSISELYKEAVSWCIETNRIL